MTYRKFGVKRVVLVILVLVILISGTIIFWRFKSSQSKSKTNGQKQSPTTTSSQTSTEAIIKNTDFFYTKPTAWAMLAKEQLDKLGALTGIGRPPGLSATFTVKATSATPTSSDDQKTSTLNTLEKLSDFTLFSSGDAKVGGQTGQKFVYSSGSDKDKVKQELYVVVYKQKTFFLLFSSPAADFDNRGADFARIPANFKFN